MMTLWRLERLRLLRTNRLLIVAAVYAFFGALGPITARYLEEILTSLGGTAEIGVEFPTPTPTDGISQFTSNAGQLGLLAVVVVAASALALDATPEIGIFLRTRARSIWTLVAPRYVTTTLAAMAALVLGTILATILTVTLIGGLPWDAMVVGTLYGAVYLAFAVAVTAAMASVSTSVLTTVLGSVGTLLGLPLLALVEPLNPWVPSELLGAVDDLVRGAPLTEYLPATLVAVGATAGLLVLTTRRLAQREV